MKQLILFSLLVLNIYTNSQAQEQTDSPAYDFASVDVLPEFPGGMAGWAKHLQKNLNYPVLARELNISGRIILQFTVAKDGALNGIKVLRGIGYGCDEEAIRVIKLSPKWKPGIQNGRPVRVSYTIPIIFQVDDEENQPMYILDGKEISHEELMKINYKSLQSANRLGVEAA